MNGFQLMRRQLNSWRSRTCCRDWLRVIFLGLLVGLPACQKQVEPTTRHTEKTKMPLDVTFKITRTELLVQENPICQLTLANSGKTTVNILNPSFNPHMPILRIIELRTGIETFQQAPIPFTGDYVTPLAAGQQIQAVFSLLSKARLGMPGDYEISCILTYDQAKKVESNAVKVSIRPVTAKNLSLVFVQGGWAPVQYGVCVNMAADPPQIAQYCFSPMVKGGIADAQTVVKTTMRAAPVAAAPPNKSVSHSHWIGWVEDKTVCFTHFDAALGALGVSKWNPNDVEAEIVASMHTDVVGDPQVRPAGAALVWVGDPNGNASSFQVLNLSAAGRIAAGPRLAVMGARPRGMMSQERSDGTRIATYTQRTGGATALQAVSWHDNGTPRRLVEWADSEFVASGGSINSENVICGATLLLKNPKGTRSPEVVTWRLDSKGNFTEEKRRAVSWPYATPVTRAVIRVDGLGNPAMLMADQAGQWFIYYGDGKVIAAPAPYNTTKLPIDLAFLQPVEPVLIVGDQLQGFRIITLDGKPLPERGG